MVDTTERIKIERRLATMSQMMTELAHELNNPLTAILGIGGLLRESASDSRVRHQADLIYRQARRAAEMVQSRLKAAAVNATAVGGASTGGTEVARFRT